MERDGYMSINVGNGPRPRCSEKASWRRKQKTRRKQMGLRVESACVAKEKGISGKRTQNARMWMKEGMLLLDFWKTMIYCSWRLVQGRKWWERRLEGACIHTLAHVFKGFFFF